MSWGKRIIGYYKTITPFDEKTLITDILRLSDPKRLFRVLCSCAYTGESNIFVGGILTRDILKATGWKLPQRATEAQIKEDNIKSKELEKKCSAYIDIKEFAKIRKSNCLELPVEWRMFYILFVPGNIFTKEERNFMEYHPCWLLPLFDDPENEI